MNKKFILFTLSLLIAIGLLTYPTKLFGQVMANEPSSISTRETHSSVPLLKNIGNYHHPISTRSKLAQRYFDQGLVLAYGFNHALAVRSFQEATKLDPNCAICYWGLALVQGPNINAPMAAEAIPSASQALQKAVDLSKNASEKEQAYINALTKRYSSQPIEDRKPLDIAYTNAMREVQKRYPDDLDAATLFAEALMDTMPWNYWTRDGKPNPGTTELLATLESILKRNPNHPGALHLHIHAVEASSHPETGVTSADRLRNLVPAAGHLVHMPGHIYIRVGRYHDAVVANQKAIDADKQSMSLTPCHTKGIYELGYVPHNYHFLLAGAVMGGEGTLAIQTARETSAIADRKVMRQPGFGTLQHYYALPLYTLTKFGKWDEILKEPAPDADLKYPNGVWHYARGMALTAKGELKQATEELEKLRAIAADPALEKVTVWDINSTVSLMKIASEVLAGELAAKQKDYTQAIAHLKTAVSLEDNLRYDEPATWYSPVRQSLGAVLLEAKRVQEAETVYREDLERYPENGWSLLGLTKSLDAQGKTKEARSMQKRFERAWKYADIKLVASRV
ncbi:MULTISPECIES: tetratricopeptide repeat protein [Nostocales]|uniref:Tetratricopeptide repeat protein n=3 Tax=Nostocales TaxID=1161 RepID=A0A0C1N6T1_9CYAN|nr:tetratricopeptide repeat protein [Tolypothrix bouteillei]KAF3886367.1 tetratricopeptide repeat protein [Tolypothrix bouteillei VB521301]